MKLRNKKTGEIGTLEVVAPRRGVADEAIVFDEIGGDILGRASSISELYEEWEDYREPEKYWFIENDGEVNSIRIDEDFAESLLCSRGIGNYFETKEEAERAVEKLKAWKRLKDKGFEFTGWDRHPDFPGDFRITASDEWSCDDKDLDLLFGGGE